MQQRMDHTFCIHTAEAPSQYARRSEARGGGGCRLDKAFEVAQRNHVEAVLLQVSHAPLEELGRRVDPRIVHILPATISLPS